jgi:hypothetical protein
MQSTKGNAMQRIQTMTIERLFCVCDRCSREMLDSSFEWNERVTISYRAGYGSVFGDGNIVEGDLCQQCVSDLLGRYLRVRVTHGLDNVRPGAEPHHAYQPHQLWQKERAERSEAVLSEAASLNGSMPPSSPD